MKNKWERRDAKEQNKKNFISDNRRSVQISARMWLEPNKPKQYKKKKYLQRSINSRMLSIVDKLNLVATFLIILFLIALTYPPNFRN